MILNDGYDMLCMMKLEELGKAKLSSQEADEITCACANYLEHEGYDTSSYNTHPQQAMAFAAEIINQPNLSTQEN